MSQTSHGKYPTAGGVFINFPSRRSVVHSTKGIVSTTSPLATEAGLQILRDGGNAAVSESTGNKSPSSSDFFLLPRRRSHPYPHTADTGPSVPLSRTRPSRQPPC